MPLAPNAYTPDTIVIGIIRACRQLGVDDLATVCAISCSKVESDHIMWANELDPHSMDYPYQKISRDKNSAGIYQQRYPWWDDPSTDDFGGSSDRMDIFRSTKMFINSLLAQKNPNYHQNPGEAIANVQRPDPRYRGRYAQQMGDSWARFNRLKDAAMAPPSGTIVTPKPEVHAAPKPAFEEINMMTGGGRTSRTRPIVNFFLHTEEGNGSAKSLAIYCNGSNGVSYHYTLRDRILCDVVDTDFASWSVLDANVFSINLCFAGSRAGMSREEWLKREDDIKIAAWIAVQDCRKYSSMSTLVIKPPYGVQAAGISDHKYVTQKLRIGNHTDVGNNFPWDVFEKYVLLYNGNTNSGDEMTKEEHDKLFQLWGVWFNDIDSDSAYAPPGEGRKHKQKDFVRTIDGRVHETLTIEHNAIVLGLPEDIKVVYAAMSYDDPRKVERAKAAWKRIPDKYKEEAGLPVGALSQ